MSYNNQLATCIREVLKEHQRDGLNMIGNVDKLVSSLVQAVEAWATEDSLTQKKTA
jgi:Txe/YoeB family toxin of Txe-Axe toxin-antitoxin module